MPGWVKKYPGSGKMSNSAKPPRMAVFPAAMPVEHLPLHVGVRVRFGRADADEHMLLALTRLLYNAAQNLHVRFEEGP